MNVDSPTSVTANGYAGGDGLDHMLRAYFQAQMPAPWPEPPVPPSDRPSFRTTLPEPVVEAPPSRVRVLSRSHLALAASVALMLGGAWILSLGSSLHPEQDHVTRISVTKPVANLPLGRGSHKTLSDSAPPPALENPKTQATIIISPDGGGIEVIGGELDSIPK